MIILLNVCISCPKFINLSMTRFLSRFYGGGTVRIYLIKHLILFYGVKMKTLITTVTLYFNVS